MANLSKLLWIACLLAGSAGFAMATDDAPWDFEQPLDRELPTQSRGLPREPSGAAASLIDAGIALYQRFFSPLDGPKCPHYPTCSQFARESIAAYGPLWGIVMTTNRLQREYPGLLQSGEYPLVFIGRWRSFDPPENAWLWSGRFMDSQRMHAFEHLELAP